MTAAGLAARPRVDPGENVVRYVGGTHFDPGTGQVDASAFDRSPKDHDGLSFNRVGVLDPEPDADRAELRRVIASRMKLGATAIFVQLNVGAALDALAAFDDTAFFFCHDPLPADGSKLANPAHALLVGLPFAGEAIGSLKAEHAGDLLRAQITNRFPARG